MLANTIFFRIISGVLHKKNGAKPQSLTPFCFRTAALPCGAVFVSFFNQD